MRTLLDNMTTRMGIKLSQICWIGNFLMVISDVLDEILDLTESVSEGFLPTLNHKLWNISC